jgi:hypothetical protein
MLLRAFPFDEVCWTVCCRKKTAQQEQQPMAKVVRELIYPGALASHENRSLSCDVITWIILLRSLMMRQFGRPILDI